MHNRQKPVVQLYKETFMSKQTFVKYKIQIGECELSFNSSNDGYDLPSQAGSILIRDIPQGIKLNISMPKLNYHAIQGEKINTTSMKVTSSEISDNSFPEQLILISKYCSREIFFTVNDFEDEFKELRFLLGQG